VQRLDTHPDIYIDSIDDLIETVLQEVLVPLSRVAYTLIKPEDNLEGENQEINIEKIMGKRRNQRELIPRWMSQGPLNIGEPLHELPRK
jgi:hypothetical protein